MERDCQHGLYKAGMGSSRVLSDFAEKYGSKNRVLAGFGIGGKSGKEKVAFDHFRDAFSVVFGLSFTQDILALEKGKCKAPPPMTTPIEKRNINKFCEFHGEVGHNTDEWQIEELLKNRKLSHVIKELKQNSGKDQPKTNKKGETSNKDKAFTILMTPSRNKESNGSSHHPLIGFSGEIIWPLGQISLLVKIGDEEHSTSTCMNFVIVRSSSIYNGIIGRPRVRKIQAVPSTAHEMLKFRVAGGILTLKSSMIIPIECAAVSGP
ncbi:hypothetical protein Tco_1077638 [Tanacetum coccineum]